MRLGLKIGGLHVRSYTVRVRQTGEVTDGTLINMSHVALSPPLVTEARVLAVEGRAVRFDVVVVDDTGEVAAAGRHVLRVIEVARSGTAWRPSVREGVHTSCARSRCPESVERHRVMSGFGMTST